MWDQSVPNHDEPSGVSIKVLVSNPRTAPLSVLHRQFLVMVGANVRTTNTALQPKIDRSRNFRRLLFQATQVMRALSCLTSGQISFRNTKHEVYTAGIGGRRSRLGHAALGESGPPQWRTHHIFFFHFRTLCGYSLCLS